MASSASSSGLDGMRCAPSVQARTAQCLEEIRNMPPENPANVIVLIGRTGVGKSTLLEYLTNATGHSKDSPSPVTLDFELETVKLGKQYYIMDTLGFDTSTEQAVFRKIVDGIKAVRPANIIGVLLVTRITDSSAEAIDDRLVAFVNKLCGPAYAAQVTAVTNFWNVSGLEENTISETRLQRWQAVLGDELKQYQYGRKDSKGKDTGECLEWRADSDDIEGSAKEMIHRHYGDIIPKAPAIVEELLNDRPLWETAAGKFLGMTSPTQSSSRTYTSSPSQAEAPTPPLDTSKSEGEEIPMPSASAHQADSNQSQPPAHAETTVLDYLKGAFIWAVKEVGIPMVKEVGVPMIKEWASGGTTRGTGGRLPSHLDPLSPRDHFEWRGMPGDLGFRTQWAREHGITLEPGSQAFGDAVRNAIERERPL